MPRPTQFAFALAILAVGLRLVAIDQPFVDKWSWRESDVAAIAQNFYKGGFHFAHPQIDWVGDQPGYVGTEFPILPFLAALSYKFLGMHEWVGRVQAVVLFALSLPCFFLLVRRVFDSTAAIWALFFYAFAPLNLFAGREFMPDVPSLSLAIIGLYFFQGWISGESLKYYWLSAGCLSLSLLVKLPSILVGAPLLWLCWEKWHWNFLRQQTLWLFAAIALVPSAIWYWHAHLIAQRFYPHHFFGAGGIQIMSAAWYWAIAKETTAGLTPLLLGLGIVGFFLNSRAGIFRWWLAVMILFIFVVGYGNRHNWYQLPLVPIMAAFAGVVCAFTTGKIQQRPLRVTLSTLLIISFCLLSFARARLLYQPIFSPLHDLGLKLKRVTPENSLIVAADNGNPIIFYYAGRKGWHFPESDAIFAGEPHDSEQAIVDLEALRRRGATHFVLTAHTSWWLDYYLEFAQYLANNATPIETNSQFKIFQLAPPAER
jgi:Dolichyl-phosphate-mannose-protein mannosyltransferase